jgi:hypothetical protein
MTYIEVEVEEHLSEVSDLDLINELDLRGYYIISQKDRKTENAIAKSQTIREQFCDMFGLNYHTDRQTLLSKISEII